MENSISNFIANFLISAILLALSLTNNSNNFKVFKHLGDNFKT